MNKEMWNHKRLQCPLATYLSTAHYYILLDGGIREICTAIYCQNAFVPTRSDIPYQCSDGTDTFRMNVGRMLDHFCGDTMESM